MTSRAVRRVLEFWDISELPVIFLTNFHLLREKILLIDVNQSLNLPRLWIRIGLKN